MPTAQQLINIAAGKIGAVNANTNLDSSGSADALVVLNSMLDSWRIESLSVYQIVQQALSWPASSISKTVGSGGYFSSIERPDRVDSAFCQDSNNYVTPIWLFDNREDYDAIPNKSVTSDRPAYLYYDPAYPAGTLNLYPTPSVAFTLNLNVWQILQSFTALSTALSLPPGYQRAIENNLAMELLPYYPNAQAAAMVAPLARASKAAIQRLNARIGTLTLPLGIAGRRRFDIYTGA